MCYRNKESTIDKELLEVVEIHLEVKRTTNNIESTINIVAEVCWDSLGDRASHDITERAPLTKGHWKGRWKVSESRLVVDLTIEASKGQEKLKEPRARARARAKAKVESQEREGELKLETEPIARAIVRARAKR